MYYCFRNIYFHSKDICYDKRFFKEFGLSELRLNIKADREQIEKLKELTKTNSNQELLNSAIALLTWAIKETQEGHIICSVDGKSYKQVVMPCLERVGISKIWKPQALAQLYNSPDSGEYTKERI